MSLPPYSGNPTPSTEGLDWRDVTRCPAVLLYDWAGSQSLSPVDGPITPHLPTLPQLLQFSSLCMGDMDVSSLYEVPASVAPCLSPLLCLETLIPPPPTVPVPPSLQEHAGVLVLLTVFDFSLGY